MNDPILPVGELVSTVPAPRPAPTTLAGHGVTLRPVDPAADAAALFACSHGTPAHDAIWTYMAYGPFADAAAMRAWLDGISGGHDPLFFTVVDQTTGHPAGMVSYLNIEPAHRRLEVGHIWYGLAAQRTAVNTAAVHLLLTHAFDTLGYRRVEWKCDARNARSRAAALRLGFTPEGLFRQHLIVKGRNRDTAWFALLDDDWLAIRANLEQWLTSPTTTGSLRALNARPPTINC